MSTHAVRFYERDIFLIDHLVQFAKEGLDKGETLLFVTTKDHRILLHRRLVNEGLIERLQLTKCVYLAMDVFDTLSRVMVDDWPDEELFIKEIGGMIKLIAKKTRIRIYGEMVAVLWAQGKYHAAICLEKLWNKLATQHDFALLCGYPSSGFLGPEMQSLFQEVCACHSFVVSGLDSAHL